MIKIENVVTMSPEQYQAVIRGMRNPMNSWEKSDSIVCPKDVFICEDCEHYEGDICGVFGYDDRFNIGENDLKLCKKLANGGPVHAKYRRMMVVYLDITAPLYWWKEFDTYKVGTVANSCSTMHKIHSKKFTLEDFSHEHLDHLSLELLETIICKLNANRHEFLEHKDSDDSAMSKKDYWWQMIQLLPSSYNQKRTVMLNYEVLVGMYKWRKNHKLDEWVEFCKFIETLPFSELITMEE